jgi:hypothetical protein
MSIFQIRTYKTTPPPPPGAKERKKEKSEPCLTGENMSRGKRKRKKEEKIGNLLKGHFNFYKNFYPCKNVYIK